MFFSMIALLLLLCTGIPFLSGCENFESSVSAKNESNLLTLNAPDPVVFFPVQKSGYEEQPYPAALAHGKLVLDNGYLRLEPAAGFISFGESPVIIWPPGSTLKTENNTMLVINEKGTCIARVGENLNIGGGEIHPDIVLKYTGQLIPEGCNGPYWLASPGIYNAPLNNN